MSRTYSEKFLIALHKKSSGGLGHQLGKACVTANIPALYIAKALEVSRMTIYNWFRDKPVASRYKIKVEAILAIIAQDMETGKLPAKSTVDAKFYMESVLGDQL